MFFDLKLEEQAEQPVLSIRLRTTIENLPNAIGESFGAIMKYMTELGEKPANTPFVAYYTLDMQDLDVEIGFPLNRALPDHDAIKAGRLPQGQVVSCMYKGAYSDMEEPYKVIMQWIDDQGHKPTGVYYEFYYNSPAEVPESELLTKIVIPVK